MMRLCSRSSRPYLGRPVSHAPESGSAGGSNPAGDETGVSRGHIRQGNEPEGIDKAPSEIAGWTHNAEEKKVPVQITFL